MSLKVMITAFVMLFLGEMGDKTQLAALALTASSKQPWSVLVGGALAITLVTALAVFFGEAVTRVVSKEYLHKGGALLFIVIGAWMWFKG
ncbi:MAG: TMEM165/GDT1 family protein [Elusimicrobia bacterium]|nr:TMEM165/GDT1 family protein [Elusimicrobiota bacterium]